MILGLVRKIARFGDPTRQNREPQSVNATDPLHLDWCHFFVVGKAPTDFPGVNAARNCVGVSVEWHLDHNKAFRHLEFHLAAWAGQPVVVIAPALLQARLEAIGAVRHSVRCDGTE